MAIDPFIQAGAGVPAGTDRDTMELAFYRARSGIADQTLSVSAYKQAYYRRILGAPGAGLDMDTLSSMFNASGTKAYRRNLMTDPRFTTPDSGYSQAAVATAQSNAQVSPVGSPQVLAASSAAASGSSSDDYLARVFGVTAGKQYMLSGYVWMPSGFTTGYGRGVWIQDNAGSGDSVFTPYANTVGAWQRITQLYTPGAGVTLARLRFYVPQANATGYFSGVLIEQASSVGDYFDGGFPGCSWEAAANNSPSAGYPGVSK